MTVGPLSGRRIVTTRDEVGVLDERLAALGAEVVHVPMIEIGEPPDDAAPRAFERLAEFDWVVVSSRHGAERVAPVLMRHPQVRVAAVGRATAAALGPGVDPLVPARQTAADLVRVFPDPSEGRRVLVVRGDRSDMVLVDGLRSRGHVVESVVAYVTRGVVPNEERRRAVEGADAVVFASGSAATAWSEGFADRPTGLVVAIGPTTASVATDVGLGVDAVASDHSVDGLVDLLLTLLGRGASA